MLGGQNPPRGGQICVLPGPRLSQTSSVRNTSDSGRLRWLELLDWDYTVLDLLHPMQKVQLIVLLCLLAAVVVDSSFLFPRAAHADDACQAVQTPIAKAGTSIVLIGNPGCGKSTLLNTLAGKPLFESGIRYQAGWSLQLQLVHFPVLINP